MSEHIEKNAGYDIIEKLTVGDTIFVLGENDTKDGTKYVTWQSGADAPTNYDENGKAIKPKNKNRGESHER